jgi:rifampicin phosphotransferase
LFVAHLEVDEHAPLCLPLASARASLEVAGGKGASLARLAAAGLPVPSGFHVTTLAYRRFVQANGLRASILDTASNAALDSPASLQAAALTIQSLFTQGAMPSDIADALHRAYQDLDAGQASVAVRSSATAEDLPGLSFAGQQDTYLNVRGDDALLDAVRRCWASLWTARAIDYRRRHAVDNQSVSLAVVVQTLVAAEAAGVLFTADPVTGARDQVTINASWGLGEALVSGQTTPDTMVVERASGKLVRQVIGDKSMMTVLDTQGTHEQPVPADRRSQPSLSPTQVAQLARIGIRIEELYGRPMDVEWAVYHDQVFILQARPITTSPTGDTSSDVWNDSLLGDYLWTNGNLGEAVPDVMTPSTWSLIQRFIADALAEPSLPGCPMVGNIGGRFYMNLSLMATLAAAFGARRRFEAANVEVFGRLPPGLDIPLVPVSRWRVIRELIPVGVRIMSRVRAHQNKIGAFVSESPARCEALRARIQAAETPDQLLQVWRTELDPLFRTACYMLQAAGRQGGAALVMTRWNLRRMVGEADADALFSGLHSDSSGLASLGLLIGLQRLRTGTIDRQTFARLYGHRGPHEFEVSIARPAEDPSWIESQLAGLRAASVDVDGLLARQAATRTAAWARFAARFPDRVAATSKRVDRWGQIARDREATRSELVRVFWVLRTFLLRAGQLTGQNDDVFFLSLTELLAVLGGNSAAVKQVAGRRAVHARYAALPPYPALIRGHFDPSRWAADPHRRSDLAVERAGSVSSSETVTGFPGAAGVVQGRVRVLPTADDGDQLQPGEILVTTVTNVGWTPLFPRAAAIVTDVGAPLSHAAIVARELGIPAVVGCGNATMRLHTGDEVRVDGSRGTVEILHAQATISP